MAEGSSIQMIPAAPAPAAASRPDDLVVVMLIAMVTAIVACVGVLRIIARRELRRRQSAEPTFAVPRLSAALFDTPSRWLAVRGQTPHAVESALAVHNPRACSWSD